MHGDDFLSTEGQDFPMVLGHQSILICDEVLQFLLEHQSLFVRLENHPWAAPSVQHFIAAWRLLEYRPLSLRPLVDSAVPATLHDYRPFFALA